MAAGPLETALLGFWCPKEPAGDPLGVPEGQGL